jgi:hypothetical protein
MSLRVIAASRTAKRRRAAIDKRRPSTSACSSGVRCSTRTNSSPPSRMTISRSGLTPIPIAAGAEPQLPVCRRSWT